MDDYLKALNQMCRQCGTKPVYCNKKKCARRLKLLEACDKAVKYDQEHLTTKEKIEYR